MIKPTGKINKLSRLEKINEERQRRPISTADGVAYLVLWVPVPDPVFPNAPSGMNVAP